MSTGICNNLNSDSSVRFMANIGVSYSLFSTKQALITYLGIMLMFSSTYYNQLCLFICFFYRPIKPWLFSV